MKRKSEVIFGQPDEIKKELNDFFDTIHGAQIHSIHQTQSSVSTDQEYLSKVDSTIVTVTIIYFENE